MKKLINFLAYSFMISISFNSNAQELKKYEGNYKRGIASYEYFENENYERILHGGFAYAYRFHDGKWNDIAIAGEFNNGKKQGKWAGALIITIEHPYYGEIEITKKADGDYNNGVKVGKWSYANKTVMGGDEETSDSYLHFFSDTLVGEIKTSSIQGQFNDKGLFVGKWQIKNDKKEYIAEFSNNICRKLIVRNASNGDIYFKYDESTLIDKIPSKNSIIRVYKK